MEYLMLKRILANGILTSVLSTKRNVKREGIAWIKYSEDYLYCKPKRNSFKMKKWTLYLFALIYLAEAKKNVKINEIVDIWFEF